MTQQVVQDTWAESWLSLTLMVTALSDKTTGTHCNSEHRMVPGGRRTVLITYAVISDYH